MTCGCSPFGPPAGPPAPSFPAEIDFGNVFGSQVIDFSAGLAGRITLTGSTTLTLSGLVPGKTQWWQLKVIQAPPGGRTLGILNSQHPGGGILAISSAANAIDILSGYWDGSSSWVVIAGLAFA